MTVKELIERLSVLDQSAKVIGYDNIRFRDFSIREVSEDTVVDSGYSDGFHKEYCLRNFFCSGFSVCDNEPLGTKFVVLH